MALVRIGKNVVDAVAACSYIVEFLMKSLQFITFLLNKVCQATGNADRRTVDERLDLCVGDRLYIYVKSTTYFEIRRPC